MHSETFTSTWLALREPVDHRSRAHELAARLDDWGRRHEASHIVDLGSGSGSNVRYLSPRLPWDQHWTLVDRDEELLRSAADLGVERLTHVASVDFSRGDLETEGLEKVHGSQIVTASALLDLVSERWLGLLVEALRVEALSVAGCAGLFALTWDGTVSWRFADGRTADPDDHFAIGLVRSHQRRDKGTGPALGPAAGSMAERAFRIAGFRTWVEPSPWCLGPDDSELVRALVDGWELAAREQQPSEASRIRAWAERRRRDAQGDGFELFVGHEDMLVLPQERPARESAAKERAPKGSAPKESAKERV